MRIKKIIFPLLFIISILASLLIYSPVSAASYPTLPTGQSYYEVTYPVGLRYSSTWYGTMTQAPMTDTVWLYDDDAGICIVSFLPASNSFGSPNGVQGGCTLTAITRQTAQNLINSYPLSDYTAIDSTTESKMTMNDYFVGVWGGDKLAQKFDTPQAMAETILTQNQVAKINEKQAENEKLYDPNRYGISGQGTCTNGTGVATGSPIRLVPGTNTITITTQGTFTVTMCVGTSASAASGTATVTSSPKSCPAATATTVTVTGTGTITITVTYSSTGNWSSTYSWSASSGGVVNASVPTSADATLFDANSFTAASQTFTINASSTCLSMDWSAVTHTPALAISSTLATNGNVVLGTMTTSGTSIWTLAAAGGTATFNSAGITLSCPIKINDTSGGTVELLTNNLNIGAQNFTLTQGSFLTNGENLTTTGIITISGASTRVFNYNSNTVTCGTWRATTTTGLTLTSNSTSVLTVNGASNTFEGGSLTYAGTVKMNGTGTTTITGSNTFNNTGLVLPSGTTQTIDFTDGTTQTVASCSLSGSVGHVHTLTGTSTAGWNLVKSGGGTVTVSYCTISYSVASPANTWYYDSTCTYNSTSGWSSNLSITNSPSTLNFGTVMPSTTYYAYNQSSSGSYPNPVTPSQCYFTITNTGISSCNIALSCSNATGGNTWTLVSSSPTGDQFEVIAVYNNENPASGLVLTNANQTFYSSLAASGTLLWDFKEILGGTGTGKSGTFSDAATKTYTITITCS